MTERKQAIAKSFIVDRFMLLMMMCLLCGMCCLKDSEKYNLIGTDVELKVVCVRKICRLCTSIQRGRCIVSTNDKLWSAMTGCYHRVSMSR